MPEALHFTGDPEADAFLASEPLALTIGFALDQQVTVKALGAVLSKRFGLAVADELVPSHPTLGDVDSPEALEAYQAQKRAYKAAVRSGSDPSAWPSS